MPTIQRIRERQKVVPGPRFRGAARSAKLARRPESPCGFRSATKRATVTAVRFAPHHLRLNPSTEAARGLTASLTIDPQPAARWDATDQFGNRVTHVNFENASDVLRIESSLELDVAAASPLRDPGLARLPWRPNANDGLAGYRGKAGPQVEVEHFVEALATESHWAPLSFLEVLNHTLFNCFDRRIRIEGAASSPAQTLATGRGACRDLAVLFMAACHNLGIAARFVSGYQAQAESVDGGRHLHAWAEVFLPGLGWRGFDPTHGNIVSDGHVALCAAPEQSAAMPVEGGFSCEGVTSTLDYQVQIASR
jgi:transglutaminase-like putative cysteine protease